MRNNASGRDGKLSKLTRTESASAVRKQIYQKRRGHWEVASRFG